jgi:hypothetical protein
MTLFEHAQKPRAEDAVCYVTVYRERRRKIVLRRSNTFKQEFCRLRCTVEKEVMKIEEYFIVK